MKREGTIMEEWRNAEKSDNYKGRKTWESKAHKWVSGGEPT